MVISNWENNKHTIKPEKGTTTVAERDGGKEINRVTYTDKDKDGNDIKREIATLDDGLKFTGDDGQTVNRTLGSNLNVKGGATTSTTAKNIRVTKAADGQGLTLEKFTQNFQVKGDVPIWPLLFLTISCGALSMKMYKGVRCKKCDTVVEEIVTNNLDDKIWVRAPEGVPALMNIKIWYFRNNF